MSGYIIGLIYRFCFGRCTAIIYLCVIGSKYNLFCSVYSNSRQISRVNTNDCSDYLIFVPFNRLAFYISCSQGGVISSRCLSSRYLIYEIRPTHLRVWELRIWEFEKRELLLYFFPLFSQEIKTNASIYTSCNL